MKDLPRQKLREIIAHYGHELCEDYRRTEALLRDLCGEHKLEISVLVNASREGIGTDLLASQDGVPREVLLSRLTKKLENNRALKEEAARWAVESWALALGVTSAAESHSTGKHKATAGQPRTPSPRPPEPGRRRPKLSESPEDLFDATELSPYTLEPGVTISSIQDLPAACDQAWHSAIDHFVKGYFVERMEARIALGRNQGRYDIVARLEPLLKIAKTLLEQAVKGDDMVRNAALEVFLQTIGKTYDEIAKPRLALSHKEIDLGAVAHGDSVEGEFVITNATRGYLTGEIASKANWLQLNTSRFGCLVGQQVDVSLMLDTSSLQASKEGIRHFGSIEVKTDNEVQSIVVQGLVGTPAMYLQPKNLDFGRVEKGEIAEQVLEIYNTGFGIVEGRLEAGGPWLKLSTQRFRCPASKMTRRKIAADTAELEPGKFQEVVIVKSNVGEQRIPGVVLVAPPPRLEVATKSAHLDPVARFETISLRNAGGGVLRSLVGSAASWLEIEPTSLELGEQESGEVRLGVDFARLPDAVSKTTLLISAPSGEKKVEVIFDGRHLPAPRSRLGWVLGCPNGETRYAKSEAELRRCLQEGCWIDGRAPRREISDLRNGERIFGQVQKKLPRGAIIDIGATASGSLHIARFSTTSLEEISRIAVPGHNVIVWITGIDSSRNVISLTMIEPT